MKIIFSLLMIMIAISNVKAQDMITLKNGDQIKCKVTEVGVTEIKYKKENTPDATVYVIDKSTVLVINYENGTKDVLNETTTNPVKKEEELNLRKGIWVGLNIQPGLSQFYNSDIYMTVIGQINGNAKPKISPSFIGGISIGCYPTNYFGISTGFNYAKYSSTLKPGLSGNNIPILLKFSANYLNIPLSFSLVAGNSKNQNFYFEIGPQYGLLLSATQQDKTTSANSSSDIKKNIKSTQWFLNGIIGCEIPISSNQFALDIGTYFNYGLTNINSSSNFYLTRSTTYEGGLAIHFKGNIFSF